MPSTPTDRPPGPPGLPGLPGSDGAPSTAAAGASAVLFEHLLDVPFQAPADPGGTTDDGPLDRVAPSLLEATRALLGSPFGDLVAALDVPAALTPHLVSALTGADVGLRVVVSAEPARGGPDVALALWRDARDLLVDEDRVDVVGVRLPEPAAPGISPATAAEALLDVLSSTATAWIALPEEPGAAVAVVEVLAADGAERAVVTASHAPAATAVAIRTLVDRELGFRARGVPGTVTSTTGTGLLNLLCAVRAALNGTEVDELTGILACTDPAPLVAAVRWMSDADAAVTRSFLAAAGVTDPAKVLLELGRLHLLADDVAAG